MMALHGIIPGLGCLGVKLSRPQPTAPTKALSGNLKSWPQLVTFIAAKTQKKGWSVQTC